MKQHTSLERSRKLLIPLSKLEDHFSFCWILCSTYRFTTIFKFGFNNTDNNNFVQLFKNSTSSA
jgi:hypothetical protein